MWNEGALLRLLAGNFWAPSHRANRFCKLCRTWLKRHWLLRKRHYIRDRKHTGGRQKSVSFLSLFCCRERSLLAGNVHTKYCLKNPQFQGKKLWASDRNVILRILFSIYFSLGPGSLVGIKGKSSWARAGYGLPPLQFILSPSPHDFQSPFPKRTACLPNQHCRYFQSFAQSSRPRIKKSNVALRLLRQRQLKLLLGRFGTCVLALPKIA